MTVSAEGASRANQRFCQRPPYLEARAETSATAIGKRAAGLAYRLRKFAVVLVGEWAAVGAGQILQGNGQKERSAIRDDSRCQSEIRRFSMLTTTFRGQPRRKLRQELTPAKPVRIGCAETA